MHVTIELVKSHPGRARPGHTTRKVSVIVLIHEQTDPAYRWILNASL